MRIRDLGKKISIVVFSVFCLNSVYGDEGDFSAGAALGQTIFASNNMDAFGSNAMAFGGFIGFAPSDILDLVMNFMYSPYSKNSNEADLFYSTLNVRFMYNYDMLTPFVMGGVGFYRSAVDSGSVDGSASAFGMNLGLGCDVLVGKNFLIGFASNYHTVFNQDVNGVNALADFFDLMLRVGFRFNAGSSSGW